MPLLTTREKIHICNVIEQACHGTPLQPHAEFAGGYLGTLIVGQIENWEKAQKALVEEDEDARSER